MQSGDHIGCYTLLALVGRGGMGEVWKAHDPVGERTVAVKLLHNLKSALVVRSRREGRQQRRVNSPFVVSILDLLDHDALPVIVMEWVQGPVLSRWRRQQQPTLEAIDAIAQGLFDGLEAVHRLGLVHRDLKPGNVLLDLRGELPHPKLTDFGIACAYETPAEEADLTLSRAMLGTPGYMAPEQIVDSSRVDYRTDLFGLGSVLYSLCAGRPAFRGANRAQVLQRTLQGQYPSLRHLGLELPERIHRTIERCLHPQPPRRPSDVEAVRALWNSEICGEEEDTISVNLSASPVSLAWVDTTWDSEESLPNLEGETHGRAMVIQAVLKHLYEDCLVTIKGTGGVGKTRVAIEVARAYPYTAWFCDLTEVHTLKDLCSAVALALGVPLKDEKPLVRLGHALNGRGEVLLVLDNAEQALDVIATALQRWMGMAPQARFVVTSRVRLGLKAERVQSLEGLDVASGIQLFVDRAQSLVSDFTLTDDNRSVVSSLVGELDGLALAIELAASQLELLSPAEVLSRLKERFRILRRRHRGVPARQMTMEASLDASWSLLAPWGQLALAQCSVFRGGFTVGAAEAVLDLDHWPNAPWPMDVVHLLVDHSLLVVRQEESGRRLWMYESIRAYAEQKMASAEALVGPEEAPLTGPEAVEALERRHGVHYAGYGTEEVLAALEQHGGVERRKQLVAEVDNLLVAIERGIAAGWVEEVVGACLALVNVWTMTGPYDQGVKLLGRVLALEGLAGNRAKLLGLFGSFNVRLGRLEKAALAYDEALTISQETGERELEGRLLDRLGDLCIRQVRMDEALAFSIEALGIAREVKNPQLQATALGTLSMALRLRGRMDEALSHYIEALAILQKVGNPQGEGVILVNLATLHMNQGRVEQALSQFTRALAIAMEVGERGLEGTVRIQLGILCMFMGRMEEADAHMNDALFVQRELGSRPTEGIVHSNLGLLCGHQNRIEEALDHYAQALAIAGEVGDRRAEGHVLSFLALLSLGQGHLKEALTYGSQALVIVREARYRRLEGNLLGLLGRILAQQDDLVTARQHLTDGECILREVNARIALAILLCHRGQVDLLSEKPTAATTALTEAESIAADLNVLPTSELAKEITSLRTALSEGNG